MASGWCPAGRLTSSPSVEAAARRRTHRGWGVTGPSFREEARWELISSLVSSKFLWKDPISHAPPLPRTRGTHTLQGAP